MTDDSLHGYAAAMVIHIARDGHELGQWSDDQVRASYQGGDLRDTDSYWHAGMTEWLPLRDLMAPPVPVTTQAPAGGAATAPARRKFSPIPPRPRDFIIPGLISLLVGYVLVYCGQFRGVPVPRDFGTVTAGAFGIALVYFFFGVTIPLLAKPKNRLWVCLAVIAALFSLSVFG